MAKHAQWFVTGAAILFLTACSSYTAAPNTQAIVKLPAFELRQFKGKSVAVTAKDIRADAADSARLERQLVHDLTAALTTAGASVVEKSPNTIDVKVVKLRADKSNRDSWEGCATMTATVRMEAQESRTVRTDRCSPTSVWAGMFPQQAATNKAYADAVVDLLSQLDAM
ncbi:MAG TPA: hypothetical protein VGR95_04345 [Thermoanaerobaculia bacterium]|jgi:uncharacterized lipoprotein YajG|nr:hypothetical protein [Thermoanaerobaculia bacterium]